MTEEEFWKLINRSRREIKDCEEQSGKLTELLARLEPKEIIDFHQHLYEREIEAYRYDIWAVAYLINGGCSDDGFVYFRGWLIAQGKEFFYAVLENPEYAATKVKNEEVECEAIYYVAQDVYEEKTGEELPPSRLKYPSDAIGIRWKEDDLEKMYPKLYKRFFS